MDAADGVIDGRSFGQNIGVPRPTYGMGHSAPTYTQPMTQSYGAPTYSQPMPSMGAGYGSGYSAPTYTQPMQSIALAANPQQAMQMDAADGIMDGRSFGTSIATPMASPYGAQSYGTPPTYG